MATGKALNGKPYAGNPHVRFDEGEVAPAATPRRGSLLYKIIASASFVLIAAAGMAAAPEIVTKEAAFWFDASTLGQAAGTELDSWSDVRGGGYPSLSTYTSTKPQVIEIAEGDLAGKKAVTFFSKGTNCDMQFSARQSIKTAFFVVDLDQIQHAFLLGGAAGGGVETYPFHRGDNGTYLYEHNADLNTVNYWNFGRPVSNPKTTLVPTGYQLITWTWPRGGEVAYACSDRGIGGRIGGKRLCEVVAFSRELNMAERSMVEGYLAAKWWSGLAAANAATLMLGRKAQVHFDASESSSFHFDVDGDSAAVSQWDDLSGNGNNFTPSSASGSNSGIHYGAVGEVGGKPVFNSGAASSGIDLALKTRLTNTRSVVMVADVDRTLNVFWLGDATDYRFHRGDNGAFVYNNGGCYLLNSARLWQNGQQIMTRMPLT